MQAVCNLELEIVGLEPLYKFESKPFPEYLLFNVSIIASGHFRGFNVLWTWNKALFSKPVYQISPDVLQTELLVAPFTVEMNGAEVSVEIEAEGFGIAMQSSKVFLLCKFSRLQNKLLRTESSCL